MAGHLVVEAGETFVFDGVELSWAACDGTGYYQGDADGFYDGTRFWNWKGSPREDAYSFGHRAITTRFWSMWRQGDQVVELASHPVGFRQSHDSVDISSQTVSSLGGEGWSQTLQGDGLGAIDAEGRALVVLETGVVVRYSSTVHARAGGTEWSGGTVDLKGKVPKAPYDISITRAGYALLLEAKWGGSIAELDPGAETRAPLFHPTRATTLQLLDEQLKERWRARVEWWVTQPPVDAGEGRVVLAGEGVACFENGQLLWRRAPDGNRSYVTAFGDGSLAIAHAMSISIVDRDGKELQSFHTKEGDFFTAPPAPAADGSIWLASDKAIYVVR